MLGLACCAHAGQDSADIPDRAALTLDAECLAIERAFAANRVTELEALQPSELRWRAQRAFRLAAIYIPLRERRKARGVLKVGQQAVRAGLREADDEVELLLLGAMLDGQALLVDRWKLLSAGWRGLRRLQRAEKLDPDNPRVALIRGTARVVAPRILGGNAQLALDTLQPAERDTPLCAGGEWAQVDVLNWLARAHRLLGDDVAARAALGRALARVPDHHWTRLELEGAGYVWTEAEADAE
ncbi:MAG: hypothetical protein AAF515_18540 [Pseudomonadota bacterium]